MRRLRGWPMLLILVITSSSLADDWAQWRGPTHDGVSAESSKYPAGWPPERLWAAKVGKGCTTPIIGGGRLYVLGWSGRGPTGSDTLHCFDARSGRELWKQTYASRYQGRHRTGDTGAYGGPSASPTLDVAAGKLYTLSVDGLLKCWDAGAGGKSIWSKDLYAEFKARQRPSVGGGKRDYGYTSAPLLWGDRLIVEVGGADGTVMAFDKATGRRVWTSQDRQPAGHTGGMTPLKIGKSDVLAVLTLKQLVVMDLTAGREGRTLATYPRRTDYGCNIATPAAAGASVLLTSAYNNESTERIDVAGGKAVGKWKSRSHAMVGSPVVRRQRAYMVHQSLQCTDLASGKLLWRGGSSGHGSCLATADDKLIVFGKGRLSLVDAGAKTDRYRELSRVDKIVRGTCYPSVILSDGVIACKDRDGALVCFSIGEETTKKKETSTRSPAGRR